MDTENQHFNITSFGFIYSGIVYIWSDKELYRQPHIKNKRSYSERKLKTKVIGVTVGYIIGGDFKSMKILKEITVKINHTRKVESKYPF